MAYSLSLSQKWDTCAGEAIIRGMKGYCTTQYGE
jgi:fructose-1,6-bisphosphatase/inositol monophosphatase family enzyme